MIEIKDVTYMYGEGKRGIQKINLKIEKGQCVLLCGKSGCGKTTVTRLINGLIPNFYKGDLKGEVLIDGKSIEELSLYELSKKVGSVFQNPRSQFFCLNTTSEMAFACENHKIEPKEIERRIEETSKLMGLTPLLNRNIFELSGGEKQRIACGAVYSTYPEIFVFDEPSSNLDLKGIEGLKKVIETLKKEGKTIVIAEHRLSFLNGLADQIVYMNEGEIKEIYSCESFLQLKREQREEKGLRTFENPKISYEPVLNLSSNSHYLEVPKMTFGYGKKEVLNIENLKVPYGKITAIIGHNGAGKSTFARCLSGLEKSKGSIFNSSGRIKRKDRLAKSYMVMQDVNHQLFTESVMDEILLGTSSHREVANEKLLLKLDLIPYKEDHPMSLSGGQKQRVVIANALLCNKEILILDEPTSGLDFTQMDQVAQLIKSIKSTSRVILIITHDLELINKCCDYALEIENGRMKKFYKII